MDREIDLGQSIVDGDVITRRGLIASAAAAALIRPRPVLAQTTGVTPVFINWNPWYAPAAAVVSRMYPNALSKPEFQFRAPWFCDVRGSQRIACEGAQADMDIEIRAANNAGIKAWAWIWYGPGASGALGNPDLHKGSGIRCVCHQGPG